MNSQSEESALLARYAQGPEQLERALEGLDERDLDTRVSQHGWTVRQVAHHIVDGDDVWKLCIKVALGNDGGEFTLGWYWTQPQEVWADRWGNSSRPIDVSLSLFRANRDHVFQLLKYVPNAWQRSIRMRKHDGHVERITVGNAIQIQVDHVTHHVAQITAVRAKRNGTDSQQ